MGITELDDNISNHYNEYIWENQMIDENKTIEIVKAEKLSDEDLEQASGGCLLYHTMELVESFCCKIGGENAGYYLKKCNNCAVEMYFRTWTFSDEPMREVSREEYLYARSHGEGVYFFQRR